MKLVRDPGKKRRSINFLDNICYSRVTDLEGNPMDLMMSIMVQNGNSEMRLATGMDDEEDRQKKPCIMWIPGGGFRGCDKNLMVAEMQFLADAGFVLASIYYRSSAEGHYPDQIIDVKTAIRFLRAHSEEYLIDPDRIGVIGRSAGGHLSSMAAMNTDDNINGEWAEYSSRVQACCNLFGPAELVGLMRKEIEDIKNNPNHRWKTPGESHGGALVGGDVPDMMERLKAASPMEYIKEAMCPMIILHGDQDPLVPYAQSDAFYDAITAKGLEEKVNLYCIKNGGHGTREFFQEETKKIILDFFTAYLVGQLQKEP